MPDEIEENDFDLIRDFPETYVKALCETELNLFFNNYRNTDRNSLMVIFLLGVPLAAMIHDGDIVEREFFGMHEFFGIVFGISMFIGFAIMVINHSDTMSLITLRGVIRAKRRFVKRMHKLSTKSSNYSDFCSKYSKWKRSVFKFVW